MNPEKNRISHRPSPRGWRLAIILVSLVLVVAGTLTGIILASRSGGGPTPVPAASPSAGPTTTTTTQPAVRPSPTTPTTTTTSPMPKPARPLPANTHNHKVTADCNSKTGVMEISIDLTNYAVDTRGNGVNTIVVTDSTTMTGGTSTLVPMQKFGTTFHASKRGLQRSDIPNLFEVKVTAWDDLKAGKSQGFSFHYQELIMPCKVPPTTTTPPPPTTTMPTDSTTAPDTTAALAAATTTEAGGTPLPNTNVNTGFPLLTAGGGWGTIAY